MEDPLLRIFAGEKMQALMNKLRLPEGEAIEAGIVSRSIETAQRKVESRNFDIRKQLLEYDDVANDQRKEIYALRNEILENKDVSGPVKELRDGYFTSADPGTEAERCVQTVQRLRDRPKRLFRRKPYWWPQEAYPEVPDRRSFRIFPA